MPTGRDLRDSLDRVAKQVESDVPRHLHQTLRIGRRRILARRTALVLSVAAAIAFLVLVSPSTLRRIHGLRRETPASTPSATIAPTIGPPMHTGPLTYATEAGIFEIDPQTHVAKRIVRASVTSFDWSPDGSTLAYVVEPRTGCEVWVQRMVSGGPRKLASCGGILSGGQRLDWSPDATRLAFVHSDGSIHVIRADGSDMRSITPRHSAISVSWSPDGTRIAYETVGGIWVMGSDGSSPRLIADGSWPTWSPDGRRIAFLLDPPRTNKGQGYQYPYVLQIWTVRPDGSQREKLAQSPDCCIGASPTLAWSPDGSMLSLTGASFKIVQADGSGSQLVHISGTISARPSWRPLR